MVKSFPNHVPDTDLIEMQIEIIKEVGFCA